MTTAELSRELARGQDRLSRLREQYDHTTDPLLAESLEELAQALEELRVSIEELAAQSEELTLARRSAEASVRHYAELFHLAPDLYLVTDPDGVILEANDVAGTKLGHRSDFLRGKPLALFAAPSSRRQLQLEIEAAQEDRVDPGPGPELRFEPSSTPGFWGSIRRLAVRDADGGLQAVRWLIRDVSERRQALADLREAAARTEAILQAAADAIVVVDSAGTIEAFNAAAEEMFGWTAPEATGQNVAILMPSPQRELHADYMARYLRTGQAQILGRRRELLAQHRDGTTFPIEIRVSRIDHLRRFAGTIRDLSEQKRLQQQLRAATAAAAVAEERERRTLGRDLHDGLGQLLALAAIKLAELRDPEATQSSSMLSEVEELVREAQARTGSLTFRLSPPLLHEVGLAAAAEWLGEEMGRRYRLRVTVEDDGRPKALDEATRTILFRGLRELLINVSKHAQTEEALVRLWTDGNEASVSVEDAGVGFDPSDAPGGFGLLSTRERLHHLGGRMTVHSIPGDGTRIVLTAPERAPGAAKEDANA